MPDRLLVGRLEIMDVQHLAGAGRLGKAYQQGLFLGQAHVLALAAAIRLGLERFDAAVVIGHVRPVDRAQRHAHRCRNRGLSHPTLAQQHHLDALALRGRYLPSQRRFQPAHFGFAAFGHLFPPNQMATANHSSWPENNSRAAQLPQTFRFKQLWSWYDTSGRSRDSRPRRSRDRGFLWDDWVSARESGNPLPSQFSGRAWTGTARRNARTRPCRWDRQRRRGAESLSAEDHIP